MWFLTPASGGSKSQKLQLCLNVVCVHFALLGSYLGMYLQGNEPPPRQTHTHFPPWEIWMPWGENQKLQPNAVGPHFTVTLPYFNAIYLQAPTILSSYI